MGDKEGMLVIRGGGSKPIEVIVVELKNPKSSGY